MDNRKQLIVKRITQALKDEGITRREFAKRMRLKRGSVTQYFKEDHDFTLKTLFRIEKALNITLIQIPDQNEEQFPVYTTTEFKPNGL